MNRIKFQMLEREPREGESLHVQILRSRMNDGESLDEAYRVLRSEAEATDPRYDKFRDQTLQEWGEAYQYLKKLI